MQTTQVTTQPIVHPDPHQTREAIDKRSFATLATVSPAGFPHAAGVLYELVEGFLYINTLRTSRKARNVAASGKAAVVVPIRRVPVGGPPSTVQFQTRARVLDYRDPTIKRLLDAGHLRSLTSHGELELPDGCFLQIDLPDAVHTYGLGMSLRRLIADPLNASGRVDFAAA